MTTQITIPDDPFATTWMPIELAMVISKPGGYKSRSRFMEMCQRHQVQVRGGLVRTRQLAKRLDAKAHIM